MTWIVIIGYFTALGVISLFSLEQLNLAVLYGRAKRGSQKPNPPLTIFPKVTVQLPVYNEKYVIERLIDCICQLEYPKDKLEIQILDDSSDETTAICEAKVKLWRASGIDVVHIRRPNRVGFKAGALQYGLHIAKGEFIAIFDADFLPEKTFLNLTIPHFHEGVGMVQTKWGHLNEAYSLLTKMQAFGLDAHFSVEQTGRFSTGKFMNFNGTGGVWRKTCIEEAGGWQHDTLTEDLDLSYRAQLKGWKFEYLEHVTTPAELPVIVPAIKSQQYRWNKGAAETARKNLFTILRSKEPLSTKFHGAMHLLNSSVYIFLLIGSILSIPLIAIKSSRPELSGLLNWASIFIVGFVAMALFYWVSSKANKKDHPFRYYIKNFPLFITFSMGLSLHNAVAVMEGYLGFKTPFIRTPKFNITSKKDSWKGNVYMKRSVSFLTILEGLLSLYFLFGIGYGLAVADYGLILFHLMLSIGFGGVFLYSVRSLAYE